jgi:guanosine-3',5'-bis(diphosphate) 3'-pyrophosphohydrolase
LLAVQANIHTERTKLVSSLERAIEIAAKAHLGQTDKGGEPYILHPIRVMLRMATLEERIVAVLHDVVEDSEWTLEALAKEGFALSVLTALEALTKLPGEDRITAAHRAAANPLARAVKLADNAENSDLSRIPNPSAKDLERLEQYRQVRLILESAGAQ